MVYFKRREKDVLEVTFKLGPGASCLKIGCVEFQRENTEEKIQREGRPAGGPCADQLGGRQEPGHGGISL